LVILVLVFILPYGLPTVEIINHTKMSCCSLTCDGSPEFTLSLLTKRPEEQKLFHIAEDSLEFLEEAKIKELLNK
jgi:molecular chaperone HtpG